MTKKRETTLVPKTATSNERSARRGSTNARGEKSTRGTAAGLRAGASSATKAKQLTSRTGKQSQKELTKRGGPGRAGNQPTRKKPGATRGKTPMRGRGSRAKAGA